MVVVGLGEEPLIISQLVEVGNICSISGDNSTFVTLNTCEDEVTWTDDTSVGESVEGTLVVTAFNKGVSDELGDLLGSSEESTNVG